MSVSQPPTSPTPEPPEPAEEENQPPQPSSSEQPAEMASPAPTPTPPTPAGLAFPPAVPPAPGSDTGPTPPNELPPADVVGGVLAAAIQQVASMVKPEAAAVVATAFSFPLILMLAVVCFLVGQGRIDARDPKLRSAPRTRRDTC